ncbi:hypothetical protein Ais01nite_13250 [Asanoa ishikariensis]|uniref:Uncharacterized protein n=1 Tax=Asanoa ishikariensis TaxID=137265 RepID=A0A1H3SX59_9ACTN|nr:leucine-rich repeat domain-containing protein [Asanoa ishikariensis]GIF63290.1 hypothetical protein Ais01nite_13250 [Asanoa ishikariensis]SDZ42723.1 hypothetical protein SAMN05421684_4902 [Asanoa ishikariensis]
MDHQPEPTPQLLPNRFATDAAGRSPVRAAETCFDQRGARVRFHSERQDTSSPGWRRLLELIEEAASDGREVFRPLLDLSPSERTDLVTLPPTIAKLDRVKHFLLYSSPLVRIPPEIGAMTSLEVFEPYTSYSLHWLPYELTRCPNLRDSTVSTRALYGNFKNRPPFPRLQPRGALAALQTPDDLDPQVWGVETIRACSVCDGQIDPARLQQLWISLCVATDVLPLLVNACSTACVRALPKPADGYVPIPHQGGRTVQQPKPDW